MLVYAIHAFIPPLPSPTCSASCLHAGGAASFWMGLLKLWWRGVRCSMWLLLLQLLVVLLLLLLLLQLLPMKSAVAR